MSATYDQRVAARKTAELIGMNLTRISGLLDEVGTVWWQAELIAQNPPSSSPGALQAAARKLADTLLALPDTDCEQLPALAFSAVTQLAALESNAAIAAAVTSGSHLGDADMWAALQESLHQVGPQLWSLVSHLVKITETHSTEDLTARQDAPITGGKPPPSQPPATGPEEARRALAMQHAAIEALPEGELRRLLDLIGGMDPAALQRAAATYTEIFSAVAGLEASVAALRPVALAVPCNDLQDF